MGEQRMPALGPEYDAMIQPAKRPCVGCGQTITRSAEGWWEDAEGWNACPNGTGAVALEHRPAELTFPKDSAGPASSSASTGGTGGLADTAAQLAGSAKDLARLARDVREEVEGRRRELWDAAIVAMHNVEQTDHAGSWDAAMAYVGGLLYAHHLVTGIDGEEQQRLLTAELDTRYGVDRAKSEGGEPS